MVRCLLTKSGVSKGFWLEAVNWSVHILNRSPIFAVKNMTPEEAWSGRKPTMDLFKIFGCISHYQSYISRDVVFDEEGFWENNIDETKQILANFDENNEDEELQTRELEEQQIPAITVEDERPQRARRRPAWMSDYEVTGIEDPITHFAFFFFRL